jgi:hypothetical protein
MRLAVFVVAAFCAVLASPAGAQTLPAPVNDTQVSAFERQTLDEEIRKNNYTLMLAAGQGFLGVLGGLGIAGWAVYTFLQTQKNAFRLKAIELALAADSPTGAKNRASFIEQAFQNVLPKGFVQKIDTEKLGFGSSKKRREAVIQLVAQYPAQRRQIIADWGVLFPYDIDKRQESGDLHWLGRLMTGDGMPIPPVLPAGAGKKAKA